MKRTILTLLIGLLLILINGCQEQPESSLTKLVKVFNQDSTNFKMFYYGKDVELLDLEVTYITTFDEIEFIHTTGYHVVVMNNLDDSLTLELDELIQLKEQLDLYKYSFYYFGSTGIDKFYQSGLINQDRLDSSALSFGYVYESGNFINVIGTWDLTANEISSEYKNLFLELLLDEFKYHIESVS